MPNADRDELTAFAAISQDRGQAGRRAHSGARRSERIWVSGDVVGWGMLPFDPGECKGSPGRAHPFGPCFSEEPVGLPAKTAPDVGGPWIFRGEAAHG